MLQDPYFLLHFFPFPVMFFFFLTPRISDGCNSFTIVIQSMCLSVCVSCPQRWTDRCTHLNFSSSKVARSKNVFNEKYLSDTAATRKWLTQMKPSFQLSAVIMSPLILNCREINDPACRIALYVEFNCIYECWGYDVARFQSICSFIKKKNMRFHFS